MTCEILSVGTELLLGDIVNTNAQYIARELARLGIHVYAQTVVGDNPARLKAAYAAAFARADLVIATGGLGPTADDITKEVAAEYFNRPLVLHEPSWAAIQQRFAGMRARITANNQKQAMMPEDAQVFPNANGTAPGMALERDGKTVILLPGPPFEMEPMFDRQVVPFLKRRSSSVLVSRTLKICGVGESAAEELLRDIMEAQTNPTIAPYAKQSEVHLRVTAQAADEAEANRLIDPVARAVRERLGENVYGEDSDTLAGVALCLLKRRGHTLACAESCTGGLLTAAIVDIPGASGVLRESFITYSNEAKIKTLNVDEATLRQFGAVSPQTAEAMAAGAAKAAGVTAAVSTTGIAGPGGGTADKPVGLVYVGLYLNGETAVKELHITGSRGAVRARAVVNALDFLRRTVLQIGME